MKKEIDGIIKVEDGLEMLWESVPIEQINESKDNSEWRNEKSKIIAELLTIKADNQNLRFKLQQQTRLLDTQTNKMHNLENELVGLHKKSSELRDILSSEKKQNIETNANFRRDNILLAAQVKQLLLASNAQKQMTSDESSSDDEFEVDFIQNHKIDKNGRRTFLIRWKGYAAKHDTWEKETNLNCPDILRQYLHLKERDKKN